MSSSYTFPRYSDMALLMLWAHRKISNFDLASCDEHRNKSYWHSTVLDRAKFIIGHYGMHKINILLYTILVHSEHTLNDTFRFQRSAFFCQKGKTNQIRHAYSELRSNWWAPNNLSESTFCRLRFCATSAIFILICRCYYNDHKIFIRNEAFFSRENYENQSISQHLYHDSIETIYSKNLCSMEWENIPSNYKKTAPKKRNFNSIP